MDYGHLHYTLRIPKNRVGVKFRSWVKPQKELLLSVAFALSDHIGMKNIRLTTPVSKESKVNLIPF